MLRSYSAELNGSKLVWLEKPPERLVRQRVLVVVEDSKPVAEASPDRHYQLADLAGRLQWQGDALQVQRMQRDAW
jgi:hypothetical protein